MKKFIQNISVSVALVTGLSFMAVPFAPSLVKADTKTAVCTGINSTNGGGNTCDTTKLPGFLKTIINILLFIIGTIAVIMIIVGGIRYVTSNGEQAQVSSAKNTILYSIVGVVVAIMAYAIVNFVIGAF